MQNISLYGIVRTDVLQRIPDADDYEDMDLEDEYLAIIKGMREMAQKAEKKRIGWQKGQKLPYLCGKYYKRGEAVASSNSSTCLRCREWVCCRDVADSAVLFRDFSAAHNIPVLSLWEEQLLENT